MYFLFKLQFPTEKIIEISVKYQCSSMKPFISLKFQCNISETSMVNEISVEFQ